MSMNRDPTARRAVRTYRQIELEFQKLDTREVKIREKYEPVEKGDAPKPPGTSHRYANTLLWEDDVSKYLPADSRACQWAATAQTSKGHTHGRPGTAPNTRLKSRALQSAFSTQVLPADINAALASSSFISDYMGRGKQRRAGAERRQSAPPGGRQQPEATLETQSVQGSGAEANEVITALEGEDASNIVTQSIPSNGIIHRRPPSASIATSKAQRLLSAKHFQPPVTMNLTEAGGDELQEITGEYFMQGRRPQSGRPTTGKHRRPPASPRANQIVSPPGPTGSRRRPSTAVKTTRMTEQRKSRRPATATAFSRDNSRPAGPQQQDSNGSRPRSVRTAASGTKSRPTSAWSKATGMSGTSGKNPGAPLGEATQEEIDKGIRELMEVGQSERHKRAIRSAKREMWESIAANAGVPSSQLLVAKFDDFASSVDDDIVVIYEDDEEVCQIEVSGPSVGAAAARYQDIDQGKAVLADGTSASWKDRSVDGEGSFVGARHVVEVGGPLQRVMERHGEGWASSSGRTTPTPSSTKGSVSTGRIQRPSTAPANMRGRDRAYLERGDPNESFWKSDPRRTQMQESRHKARPCSSSLAGSRGGRGRSHSVSPPTSPEAIPLSSVRGPAMQDSSRRKAIMAIMAPGIRRAAPPEEEPDLQIRPHSVDLQARRSWEPQGGGSPPSSTRRQSGQWVMGGGVSHPLGALIQELSFGGGVGGALPVESPSDATRLFLPEGTTAAAMMRSPTTSSRSSGGGHRRRETSGVGATEWAHLDREFYHLQVAVNTEETETGSLRDWQFDVTLSELGGQGRRHLVGSQLHVDENNHICFPVPNGDPTVLCPVDVLPWVTAPEELFRTHLRIEVCATVPRQLKVVDTAVWFGPWDEEPPAAGPLHAKDDAESLSAMIRPCTVPMNMAVEAVSIVQREEGGPVAGQLFLEKLTTVLEATDDAAKYPTRSSPRTPPRSPRSIVEKVSGESSPRMPLGRPSSARPSAATRMGAEQALKSYRQGKSMSLSSRSTKDPQALAETRAEIVDRLKILREATELQPSKIGAVKR